MSSFWTSIFWLLWSSVLRTAGTCRTLRCLNKWANTLWPICEKALHCLRFGLWTFLMTFLSCLSLYVISSISQTWEWLQKASVSGGPCTSVDYTEGLLISRCNASFPLWRHCRGIEHLFPGSQSDDCCRKRSGYFQENLVIIWDCKKQIILLTLLVDI